MMPKMTITEKGRMTAPESEFKKKLIRDVIEPRGAFWSRIDQGGVAKPGDPDLIVCYKGRFIGVECKTYNGSLRPLQIRRIKEIKDAGGICIVARCNKDLESVFEEIDGEIE